MENRFLKELIVLAERDVAVREKLGKENRLSVSIKEEQTIALKSCILFLIK